VGYVPGGIRPDTGFEENGQSRSISPNPTFWELDHF